MNIDNAQSTSSTNSSFGVNTSDTPIFVNESVNTDGIEYIQNEAEILVQLSGAHETSSLVDNEVQLPQTNFVETGLIDMDDQLPELMSVSDDSDDSEDVHDVEMTLVTDEQPDSAIIPSSESIVTHFSHSPTRAGSRRLRAEEEDEDEFNRRRSSPRLLPSYTPPSSSSSLQTPSPPPYVSTSFPSIDEGAMSATPDRPTRPMPRNGPSPLRHHHIPFGTGLVPTAMPFNIRSMFSHIIGPTSFGQALLVQSANNENQAQLNSSTDIPASAPANTPAPIDREYFQNQFTGRAPAGAMFSFFAGPLPGVSTQQQSSLNPGAMDFTAMGFFHNGPNATPHAEAAYSQAPRDNQPNEGSQWRSPPEFIEGLIRSIFRGGLDTGFDRQEREDPERAAKLVAGLEEVPVGLIKRMERLISLTSMYSDASNDANVNCAVCWEKLLSDDSIESLKSNTCEGRTEDGITAGTDATSESPSLNSSPKDVQSQKIVVLPCAHVFHDSCLIPWFSRPRQATCPTCRFNIDPENLTYVFHPDFGNNSNRNANTPPFNAHATADADPTHSQQLPNQRADTRLPELPLFSQPPQPSIENPSRPSLSQAEPAAGSPDVSGRPLNTTPRIVPQGPVLPPFLQAHFDSMPMHGGPSGNESMVTLNFDFIVADAPPATGTEARGTGNAENTQNTSQTSQNTPLPSINEMFNAFPPFFAFGPPPRSWPPFERPSGPKKEWVLPSAPGLTLRQRVEKQEREAGLRCWDTSCGVGPTDDDPYSLQSDVRQISIHLCGEPKSMVCSHTFHPECLVTAERVAGWGSEEHVKPEIEVACPVCRAVGVITNQEWEEGDRSAI